MLTEHLDCLVREQRKSKQAPYIDIEGVGGVKISISHSVLDTESVSLMS